MPDTHPDHGTPGYLRMADDLRERITAGEYPPGAKLPSERDLADRYRLSRPTVRQAIAELRSTGLVIAEHGRGLFVRRTVPIYRLAGTRPDDLPGPGRVLEPDQTTTSPERRTTVEHGPAGTRLAGLLAIDPTDEVIQRHHVITEADQPIQLATTTVPACIAARTPIDDPDTAPADVRAHLAELGHKPARYEDLLHTRMPTPEEATALQLGPGTPILLITRVAITGDGTPVQVEDITLAGDRYELSYGLPAQTDPTT